ncbi:hypothetical protein N0V87_002611 [Didymella glomerata]|uniref:Uncharacterized protein n=1 Tax=Didymella glomerata TaxID=749621 RepID=A0A9W9C270_9PLEO|nr:hypothetical protein N0V87_002611 [Didymella glomerata]
MNGTRLLRNSNPQATSAAQAVVNFIYEGVQLPSVLAQYAGFFTGLFTGALGGFALHAYFQRNKCDKAKVKLAIYHVLRVTQGDPQMLLSRIETEVMHLVDEHLTQKETAQVTKAVKRNYINISNISFDEVVHKRVREDYRDVFKERQGPALATAYQQTPRGFLAPTEAELPYQEYVPGPRTASKAICQSPFMTEKCSDSLLEESDEELGLDDNLMVIDKIGPSPSGISHVPDHLFGGSYRRTACLPSCSSAHQSIVVGRADTSVPKVDEKDDGHESEVESTKSVKPAGVTAQAAGGLQVAGRALSPRHAPEFGSYGLDYNGDIYSSSDDEGNVRTSGPLPVVRQCDSEKCSGTQPSPILGSPRPAEDLPAALSLENWSKKPEMEFSSSESEREDSSLATFGVNMSTVPKPEYSSSELGSPGAMTTPSRSPAVSSEPAVAATPLQEENARASTEETGGSQALSPEVSSPSRKRKSTSPSPSLPSKRARTSPSPSPLVDVPNGPSTPTRRASATPTRKRAPLWQGRRYGILRPVHIEQAEQAQPSTPSKKAKKAVTKIPATATRKSPRIEEQKKKKKG